MRLEITKAANEFFTPVSTSLVEEREGSIFSLICELISSNDNTNSVDDNLLWIVQSEKNLTSTRSV